MKKPHLTDEIEAIISLKKSKDEKLLLIEKLLEPSTTPIKKANTGFALNYPNKNYRPTAYIGYPKGDTTLYQKWVSNIVGEEDVWVALVELDYFLETKV